MDVDPAGPFGRAEAAGTPTLRTNRLLLRRWRPEDRAPFARLNADPALMEFFPHPLAAAQSDRLANHGDRLFDRYGYGLWAVEVLESQAFIGFVGLSAVESDDPFPDRPFPFAPTVEVGWRLAREAWGQGYAPEAARHCLRFGFEVVGLEEIVSFTSTVNLRSRRVMEKIGMHRDAGDDFDHPRLTPGDPLLRHVLYRLQQDECRSARDDSGTGHPVGTA